MSRGRAAASVAAAAVAAVVAAAVWLALPSGTPAADPGRPAAADLGRPPAPPWVGASAQTRAPGDPFHRAAGPSGPPTRLRVPAIGVDSALETLHIGPGGELTTPRDFAKAGWYAEGTAPGDVGPAVIAGHVDSTEGPAVFYELRRLRAGDTIEVSRGGRTVTFTVMSTARYPKDEFPTERVYGATPDRQLRLITCGGDFDTARRSYRDNLVVYAVAG